MYAKRVQLLNYGPIERVDIAFPIEGDISKPVVLVGENGAGKSILLSHIVNGLINAKDILYPGTPEMATGTAYKLRSDGYIRSGAECYFSRVEFEDNIHIGELRSRMPKNEHSSIPSELSGPDAHRAWRELSSGQKDHLFSNIHQNNEKIKKLFSKRCILYFPHNRFEEPAWLNQENMTSKAEYMNVSRIAGSTDRRIVSYSPLRDNQNWLFDLIYDRTAFEIRTTNLPLPITDSDDRIPLPVFLGFSGNATSIYNITLQIVRTLLNANPNVRFGIGGRLNRVVSLEEGETRQIVPNIFQLSSGETSLLDLFLSILRDFDLCGVPFSKAKEVQGIVAIDEIDLHLHATHQYTILPSLIQMFPGVQFIFTTHSPLLVLGMNKVFGQDGFALYQLPSGQQIFPEEFGEFESAYQTLSETRKFSDEIRTAIERAQHPVIFVEGDTDREYIQRACELLGNEGLLEHIDLRDGGGSGRLRNIWKGFRAPLSEIVPQKVLLLFDCDNPVDHINKGNLYKRTIPLQSDNPIKIGIENLFAKSILLQALEHKPAFINIVSQHTRTERGEECKVPERWTVDPDEKTNLCTWICQNGEAEDFEFFRVIFEILDEFVSVEPPTE